MNKEQRRDAEFLMFIGALVAALCGSCTLYFQTTSNPHDHGWAGVSLIVGGIPALLGLLLLLVGYRRRRRLRSDD